MKLTEQGIQDFMNLGDFNQAIIHERISKFKREMVYLKYIRNTIAAMELKEIQYIKKERTKQIQFLLLKI